MTRRRRLYEAIGRLSETTFLGQRSGQVDREKRTLTKSFGSDRKLLLLLNLEQLLPQRLERLVAFSSLVAALIPPFFLFRKFFINCIISLVMMFCASSPSRLKTLMQNDLTEAAVEGPRVRYLFVRHGESENNIIHMDCKQQGEPHMFTIRRHVDPELTQRGRMQVKLVAERIASEAAQAATVSEIWTSYLRRALDTARAVHSLIPHAKVHAKQHLHEVGGLYRHDPSTNIMEGVRGRSNKEVLEDLSLTVPVARLVLDEMCEDGWYKLPVRETHAEALARARDLVSQMQHRAQTSGAAEKMENSVAETIVVITHGDFFQLVVQALGESYGVEAPRPRLAPPTPTASSTDAKPFDADHVAVQNTSVSLFEYVFHDQRDAEQKHRPFSFRIPFVGDASHLEGRCEALVGS